MKAGDDSDSDADCDPGPQWQGGAAARHSNHVGVKLGAFETMLRSMGVHMPQLLSGLQILAGVRGPKYIALQSVRRRIALVGLVKAQAQHITGKIS